MFLPLNFLPACLLACLILGSSTAGALDLLFESDLDTRALKELLFSPLLKKDENVALILEGFEVERWFPLP